MPFIPSHRFHPMRQSFRTGKTITVGFGLVVRNANGVGSRFRATINHMEDALSENDSRPLPQNTTLISLPVLTIVVLIVLMLSHRAPAQPARPADIGNRTLHDHLQTIVRADGRPVFDARGELVELDLASQRTSVSDVVVESVVAFPSIRKLRVAGNLSPSTVARLAKLRDLEDLYLQDVPIDDKRMQRIAVLPKLKRLTVRRSIALTEKGVAHLKQSKTLESIALLEMTLPNTVCDDLAAVPTLAQIDLRGCSQINIDGVRKLQPLENLRILRLRGPAVDDNMLAVLAGFPRLTGLALEQGAYTAAGLEKLGDLPLEELVLFRSLALTDDDLGRLFVKLDKLKRLTLRDMIVFGRALEKLPVPERLEDLRLSETWVGDDLAPFLARCPKLRHLDLRATQIGDATAAQLHSLGELRYLQLEETRLTDEGVKSLADLKKLEFLSVAKTSVTTEGIQRLQAALPDCEITTQALF
jgi:hypothetical protein